jgi:lipopolysaccharide transport system permease protein
LAKYRGSVLGLAWSFLTPILMLLVYTFVFRTVFKARWPGSDSDSFSFALQIYTGLIVFGLFSEIITRAPRLILDAPNLVTKVVFPLEVLPWVAIMAALFHFAVNLLALSAATLLARGSLPITIIAIPVIILAFVPFLLGLGWFLASIGVFVRDVQQAASLLVGVLMFLSPIFYPVSSLPAEWQPVLMANPLTTVIEQLRQVILAGQWLDWEGIALLTVLSIGTGAVGAYWFAFTRKGFADVL